MSYATDRKARKQLKDAKKVVFENTPRPLEEKAELIKLGDRNNTTIIVTGYTDEAKEEARQRYQGMVGINHLKSNLKGMDNNRIFV